MVDLEEEIMDKDFTQSYWLALQFWVQPNRIFTLGVPQAPHGINVPETNEHHLRPTSFPGLSFCSHSMRVVWLEESTVFGFCILPYTPWVFICSLRPKRVRHQTLVYTKRVDSVFRAL